MNTPQVAERQPEEELLMTHTQQRGFILNFLWSIVKNGSVAPNIRVQAAVALLAEYPDPAKIAMMIQAMGKE